MSGATIGRFAPTPSGPLHFGSLVTAVGSYLDARHQGGAWLLRIDDLDTARTRPGAVDSILRTLDGFGLEWTGSVVYQSQHAEFHAQALERLIGTSRCYRCTCTRKEVALSTQLGPDGPVYQGRCRSAAHPEAVRHAWRVDTRGVRSGFRDRVLGEIAEDLASFVGDFVVRRSDLAVGYHLASVVDDQLMGVTDVVRGSDLVPSTLRQVYLCRLLSLPVPVFAHLPVVVDAAGRKLSKSSKDRGVDAVARSTALHDALTLLGQGPPAALMGEDVRVVLDWGLKNWDIGKVSKSPVQAEATYLP
jgi:glutamyl-Q tRNA(Asp) synthetase